MATHSGPFNELAIRGWRWARDYRPAKRRTDDSLFAHAHSEVSEAWVECREGRMETRYEQGTRYEDGVTVAFAAKPKGLPAELADVIIMVSIIAGKHNIDLDQAISEKFAELDLRLTQKLERKLA